MAVEEAGCNAEWKYRVMSNVAGVDNATGACEFSGTKLGIRQQNLWDRWPLLVTISCCCQT